MTGLASSLSAISRARSRSGSPANSISMRLPMRTEETSVTPSLGSAFATAWPCGSRISGLSMTSTTTRATGTPDCRCAVGCPHKGRAAEAYPVDFAIGPSAACRPARRKRPLSSAKCAPRRPYRRAGHRHRDRCELTVLTTSRRAIRSSTQVRCIRPRGVPPCLPRGASTDPSEGARRAHPPRRRLSGHRPDRRPRRPRRRSAAPAGPTTNIIGGGTVSSAPWAAAVFSNGSFTCSGTIISAN